MTLIVLYPVSYHKMLDFDLLEQIAVIRQTLSPLRLTRWQMFRLMVASIVRTMPTFTLSLIALGSLGLIVHVWSTFTRSNYLKRLGLPILGGSKQHRLDFKQLVEEGKKKV